MLEKDVAITAPLSLDLYDENTMEKSPMRTSAYCLPVQLSSMLCCEGVLTYIVEKALADTCQPEQPLRADSAGKSLLPHRTRSP